MTRLLQRKFLLLLWALLGLVVLYPAIHETFRGRPFFAALLTSVVLAGVVAVFPDTRRRLGALVLSFPLLLVAWLGYDGLGLLWGSTDQIGVRPPLLCPGNGGARLLSRWRRIHGPPRQ